MSGAERLLAEMEAIRAALDGDRWEEAAKRLETVGLLLPSHPPDGLRLEMARLHEGCTRSADLARGRLLASANRLEAGRRAISAYERQTPDAERLFNPEDD